MSFKNQALRDLVVERLALAADEIFALFERTFAEYEEEFLRSKLAQPPRVELAVVQPLPVPPDVHPSPPPTQEEQKLLVKKETSLELPVSSLPVKSEEMIEKPTFLQQEPVQERRPEPIIELQAEEEPGCSLDLHLNNDTRSYSCSDTDDSNDWEPAEKRRTKTDGQDADLVLIEDSNPGRDDENALLSYPNLSGNAILDLQNHALFNLPIPAMKTAQKSNRKAVCSRVFGQEAHLRSHQQSHDAGPFRCSVCSKEFHQRAHLKRHMQSHSAEKSFSCPECGLRLKQQHNMHRHISAVHRREKPYSCLFCQKAFAQKSDFVIHMRTHTGEKPFVCSFCRKGFRVRASLNKHIQKSHSGV